MKHKKFGIDDKTILIAEVGQAHDGSLGAAHAFIDVVADIGFDAIKFQTHFASSESTFQEKFRIKFSYQDDDRYAYWKRMEFTPKQWQELYEHASQKNLYFLSSPFSLKAFNLLSDLNVPAWKIASGEYKSWDLVDLMIESGKPIIVSTGMSSFDEINTLIGRINKNKNKIYLLQCTSMYPTPLKKVGLNNLDEFKSKFSVNVGLSDHSGSIWPSILAISKNVSIIEVHITLHKNAFGPDTTSSLTPDELKMISDARNNFDILNKNNVDKDKMAMELTNMRQLFTKSFSVNQTLKKGTIIKEEMLILKKPGGGISENDMNKIVGRKLINDVSPENLLLWEDFE